MDSYIQTDSSLFRRTGRLRLHTFYIKCMTHLYLYKHTLLGIGLYPLYMKVYIYIPIYQIYNGSEHRHTLNQTLYVYIYRRFQCRLYVYARDLSVYILCISSIIYITLTSYIFTYKDEKDIA